MTTSLVDQHFLKRGEGCEHEMEVDWLCRHLPRGNGPITDLGCGIGPLFEAIGQNRVIGLDYSQEGLSHTQRCFPNIPLLCGSAETLPFAEESLEAITAQHLIEHLADYTGAVRTWYRVLKPGGTLLILTPNRLYSDPSVYDDETHVRIFDHIELSRLLRQSGFLIQDIRTLGLPWLRNYHSFPAGWRMRRLVTGYAQALANIPKLRWQGQTLCCAACKPNAV